MEISQDEKVTVTEEVDGGVQTVSAKLPMIITTDLRYPSPRSSLHPPNNPPSITSSLEYSSSILISYTLLSILSFRHSLHHTLIYFIPTPLPLYSPHSAPKSSTTEI